MCPFHFPKPESPFNEGTNVYQARALLRRYDTTEYYSACEFSIPNFVNNASRFLNATSETVSSTDLSVLVFPNPANNEITIASNMSDAEFILYNLLGAETARVKLKGNDKLNVSELPSGVYLFKITKDGAVVKSEKIMINH